MADDNRVWDQREDLHSLRRAAETPEEKARRIGVPVVPRRPPRPPVNPDPILAVCGECGVEIRRVMMYSCQNGNCPCGLGPTAVMTAFNWRPGEKEAAVQWSAGGTVVRSNGW